MKKILCTLGFSLAITSLAKNGDGLLVHDERGNVVTTRTGDCVFQDRADPKLAKEACDRAMGRIADIPVAPPRVVVVTPPEEVFVHFDTDKAMLNKTDAERISEAAKQAAPNHEIVVRAYTDYRGKEAHNRELAARRARAAVKVLEETGVSPRVVLVETKIPAQPKAASPCSHLKGTALGACLANDRKVEVEIRAR